MSKVYMRWHLCPLLIEIVLDCKGNIRSAPCNFGSAQLGKACMQVCDEANRKVTFKWKNHTFSMAESCPKGCDASDGVGEALQYKRVLEYLSRYGIR